MDREVAKFIVNQDILGLIKNGSYVGQMVQAHREVMTGYAINPKVFIQSRIDEDEPWRNDSYPQFNPEWQYRIAPPGAVIDNKVSTRDLWINFDRIDHRLNELGRDFKLTRSVGIITVIALVAIITSVLKL